jgi:hypothetical protein
MGKWKSKPGQRIPNDGNMNNETELAAESVRQVENAQLLTAEEIAVLEVLGVTMDSEMLQRLLEEAGIAPATIPPLSPVTPVVPLLTSEPPTMAAKDACDTFVGGTGVSGSVISVTFPDDLIVTTIVNADGTWVVDIPPAASLRPGEFITANQTTPGMLPSSAVSSEIIGAGRVVTGTVYPVAYDDHGLGPDFLPLFDITVHLRIPGTCTIVSSTIVTPIGTTGTGRFCFMDAPEGDYTLYIERPGYLVRTLAVHIQAGIGVTTLTPPDADSFGLIFGDANWDKKVGPRDLSYILSEYGTVYPGLGYSPQSDSNADGVIDMADYDLMLANWEEGYYSYSGFVVTPVCHVFDPPIG